MLTIPIDILNELHKRRTSSLKPFIIKILKYGHSFNLKKMFHAIPIHSFDVKKMFHVIPMSSQLLCWWDHNTQNIIILSMLKGCSTSYPELPTTMLVRPTTSYYSGRHNVRFGMGDGPTTVLLGPRIDIITTDYLRRHYVLFPIGWDRKTLQVGILKSHN